MPRARTTLCSTQSCCTLSLHLLRETAETNFNESKRQRNNKRAKQKEKGKKTREKGKENVEMKDETRRNESFSLTKSHRGCLLPPSPRRPGKSRARGTIAIDVRHPPPTPTVILVARWYFSPRAPQLARDPIRDSRQACFQRITRTPSLQPSTPLFIPPAPLSLSLSLSFGVARSEKPNGAFSPRRCSP